MKEAQRKRRRRRRKVWVAEASSEEAGSGSVTKGTEHDSFISRQFSATV